MKGLESGKVATVTFSSNWAGIEGAGRLKNGNKTTNI